MQVGQYLLSHEQYFFPDWGENNFGKLSSSKFPKATLQDKILHLFSLNFC